MTIGRIPAAYYTLRPACVVVLSLDGYYAWAESPEPVRAAFLQACQDWAVLKRCSVLRVWSPWEELVYSWVMV